MAKKRIRVTIEGQTISAPIFELDHMAWNETKLGCPYCQLFSQIKPKLDVIQFGLLNNDIVHTIVQCEYCTSFYALHYVNTQEVTE